MRPTLFLAAIVCSVLCMAQMAEASLQVFPTRVLITDQKRAGQIALRHIGPKPQEYEIRAIFYRMMPDGKMVLVKEPKPEERSATKMLRFSPRRILLPPNEEQVVRIISLLPAGIETGDYRAHLYFEATEDETPKPQSKTKTMEIHIEAKMAIAVPVVIRHGRPESTVTLSDLKIVEQEGKLSFSVQMQSTGTSFPHGDFYLFYTPQGSSTPEQVGLSKGVSSYVAKRSVLYPLTEPGKLKKQGSLKLEFRAPLEEGGKVLSSTESSYSLNTKANPATSSKATN